MRKHVYLIAFAITAVIFVLVFSLARSNEETQIRQLYTDTVQLNEELQANKIIASYLNPLDQNAVDSNVCLIYERQISRQLNRIYDLFNQLEKLDAYTFAVSKDSVKRAYLLTSLSLWIDLKNTSRFCSFNIKPVLYFFPKTQDCVLCSAMQNQLEELKARCPSVRVFAFPSESQEFEFVSLLKKEYHVSAVPALVIKNRVFTDIQDTRVLEQLLECPFAGST